MEQLRNWGTILKESTYIVTNHLREKIIFIIF